MRSLILAVSIAALAAPAFAQQFDEAAAERMQASMAQAQADAVHPGDDALTCEQLETEMIATMDDPAVKARIAASGEQAQQMQNQAREAQGRMRAQMAVSFFTGLAATFIPGAGYAQGLAMQAQARSMQAQQQQNMAQMATMMENMQAIMPQMMRGQQIYTLGQNKQCEFVQERTPPTE